MIRCHNTNENFRSALNIPDTATVFGRYGGINTFDIYFVIQAIQNILTMNKNENIYFIFMNTDVFYNHERIFYFKGTTCMKAKKKFINTCDAMIHARIQGETFGLACGEFACCSKSVITYENSKERNHIDILKNKAILYKNYEEIYEIFNNFDKNINKNMKNNGYLEYTPEKVMYEFNKNFLI